MNLNPELAEPGVPGVSCDSTLLEILSFPEEGTLSSVETSAARQSKVIRHYQLGTGRVDAGAVIFTRYRQLQWPETITRWRVHTTRCEESDRWGLRRVICKKQRDSRWGRERNQLAEGGSSRGGAVKEIFRKKVLDKQRGVVIISPRF